MASSTCARTCIDAAKQEAVFVYTNVSYFRIHAAHEKKTVVGILYSSLIAMYATLAFVMYQEYRAGRFFNDLVSLSSIFEKKPAEMQKYA
jgi:hypothetical protein